MVVAVFALLVAIGATGVAVYSLDIAREAKSRAAAAGVGQPGPGGQELPSAQPSSSATTPAATRTPEFVADLVRAPLRIAAAAGCASSFVDVDTMQVGVFAGHDFYLTSCLGPQTLRIDRTDAAAPTSSGANAQACAVQLAGITQTQELTLQVSPGTTFCLLTSKDDAVSAGIPQRIGIVQVTDVGADQSVTLSISTYRAPPTSGSPG